MGTKTLNRQEDRQEFLRLKRVEGYTHVVSYCPIGHDRNAPWPQLFCKSAKDAKIYAKEYQDRGLSAIWAGLNSPVPR